MHDSSIFKIKIDFEKSHDSFIYDKNTQQYFLDFFGQFASLPLGYNHEIFNDLEFRSAYLRAASVKVSNCETISDEAQEFLKEFSGHQDMAGYRYFYFCCTGALAIEAAIKTAIDYKESSNSMIIGLKESFHGINSYGGFLTDKFYPVSDRLDGFPQLGWHRVISPKIIYANNVIDEQATNINMEQCIKEILAGIEQFGKENIAAILIEPIQATYGDNYLSLEFFKEIRQICDQYNICLVFDEIQTGLGATGKMWYFQYLDIEPDIVVFGKKVQSAGIMCKEKYGKIFQTPIRLEVTWDSTVADMIRGTYVLRAYKKYDILDNVNKRGAELAEGLINIQTIKNVRNKGLLAAFDFDYSEQRDKFFKEATRLRFLCNKTRDKTIRLRPSLSASADEIQKALAIIVQASQI